MAKKKPNLVEVLTELQEDIAVQGGLLESLYRNNQRTQRTLRRLVTLVRDHSNILDDHDKRIGDLEHR
jgi:hypothetical protein